MNLSLSISVIKMDSAHTDMFYACILRCNADALSEPRAAGMDSHRTTKSRKYIVLLNMCNAELWEADDSAGSNAAVTQVMLSSGRSSCSEFGCHCV